MPNSQSSSRSVLIVEDDEHIGHLLEFMLQREGYVAHLARDGREALQAIQQDAAPPHLVLLDVMLPYTDGFELVAIMRKQAGWESLPIIMLTSKSQEQDIVRALDAGANDYVIKPFQPNELLARLRRFLQVKA